MTKKVTPVDEFDSVPTERSQSAIMKDYYKNEIKKKRKNCTDILCLILFIIFIVVQVALSCLIYFSGGNPKNILLPRDSGGNLCTEPTKNLFYFNIVECIGINTLLTGCSTPTVCVQECPSNYYFYKIQSHRDILFKNYCRKDLLQKHFSGSVPVSVNEATYVDLAKKKICPAYTIPYKPFYSRCIPAIAAAVLDSTSSVIVNDSSTNQSFQINDLNQNLNYNLIKKGTEKLYELMNIKNFRKFFFNSYFCFLFKMSHYLILSHVYNSDYFLI